MPLLHKRRQALRPPEGQDNACESLLSILLLVLVAESSGNQQSQVLDAALAHSGLTLQVHDIEDLNKAGKEHKACPYFAARHFAGI